LLLLLWLRLRLLGLLLRGRCRSCRAPIPVRYPLVEATNARLDQAVEEGHLSQEHADELKTETKERVEAFVNGEPLRFEHRWGRPGKGPGMWPARPGAPDTDDDTAYPGAAA